VASVLKRGLTLAEILLSLALCVVAVLSAIALAIASLRANTKSSDTLVAQGRASQVLEEFVYQLPPSTDSFWATTTFATPYQQDITSIGGKPFQARLYLTSLAATAPGLLRCVVNVTWQSAHTGQAGQGIQVAEVTRLLYAP